MFELFYKLLTKSCVPYQQLQPSSTLRCASALRSVWEHRLNHFCSTVLGSVLYETVRSEYVYLYTPISKKVTYVEELQSYPDHPDRFEHWPQLLCRTGLTGRCYWEVEWRGDVDVSVSYRGIRRRGGSPECVFGFNDQSWSLFCFDEGYSVSHKNIRTKISSSSSSSSSSSVSHRVAVYVDCPAGSLSFYRVSSDTLIHLHTFNTTFTEPLYPGFMFWTLETLLTEDQLTLFTLSSWSVSWLVGVIMGGGGGNGG
uniref:B30.2/SPRY domain-containing protein n=1 Tax=Labrus bergylta TaxID=56723 RepID=A0A3Q3LIN5_9LABR